MFDEGKTFRGRVYEKADMDRFSDFRQQKATDPLLEDSWLLFTEGTSGQESR